MRDRAIAQQEENQGGSLDDGGGGSAGGASDAGSFGGVTGDHGVGGDYKGASFIGEKYIEDKAKRMNNQMKRSGLASK